MIEHAYLTEDDLYAEVYVRTVARSGRERHWCDLLYALEEQGWIAWQAGILGGLEVPSRELERYVLPYLVGRGECPGPRSPRCCRRSLRSSAS